MSSSPDVIVVGGGLMGCSVAYRLAERGLRVVVLEKSVPGAEASSAAGGILGPTVESFDQPVALQLGLRSRELHAKLAEELLERTGVEVGFRRCGVTKLAFDAAEADALQAQADSLATQGVRSERWSAADLSREEPACSSEALGALHMPDDAQVEPRALLDAIALAAQRLGAQFRSGATVHGIPIEGSRVRGVELDEGRLQAPHVVVAAGSWTSTIPGLPLRRGTIFPVRGQMISARTRPPLFRGIVFGAGGYVVTRPDGRGLCGSTEEHVGFRRGVTLAGLARIIEIATRIAPSLADVAIEDHWSSFRPGTPDGLPLVGRAGPEGLFLASGHFRNGILLAPLTAELVADAVTGRPAHPPAAALSPMRFAEGSE